MGKSYRSEHTNGETGGRWALTLIRDEKGTEYLGEETRILGEYTTEAEAQSAGRAYLREHAGAWLQTSTPDGSEARDVEVAS